MKTFGMLHEERIEELARVLDLPEWLVEALIIEYLPCRQFLENDSLVLLDFNLIKAKDILQIPKPYVILHGILLLHNMTSNVLSDRNYVPSLGLPMVPANEATFVPEGQVSPAYLVPEFSDITDWKMERATTRALIIEENNMFQWRIINGALEDTFQVQVKSEAFSNDQLEALSRLQDKFYTSFVIESFPADESASSKMRKELKKLYEDLEMTPYRMLALAHFACWVYNP